MGDIIVVFWKTQSSVSLFHLEQGLELNVMACFDDQIHLPIIQIHTVYKIMGRRVHISRR